jgi:hypothetical protein
MKWVGTARTAFDLAIRMAFGLPPFRPDVPGPEREPEKTITRAHAPRARVFSPEACRGLSQIRTEPSYLRVASVPNQQGTESWQFLSGTGSPV